MNRDCVLQASIQRSPQEEIEGSGLAARDLPSPPDAEAEGADATPRSEALGLSQPPSISFLAAEGEQPPTPPVLDRLLILMLALGRLNLTPAAQRRGVFLPRENKEATKTGGNRFGLLPHRERAPSRSAPASS